MPLPHRNPAFGVEFSHPFGVKEPPEYAGTLSLVDALRICAT